MNIPNLLVYISAEILIALTIISAILFLKNRKLSLLIDKLKAIVNDLKNNTSLDENSFDLSNDYTGYLDQELNRNQGKLKSLDTIPLDEEDAETTQKNETNKALLNIREAFLNTEKKSADHSDNENAFWDSIYTNIQDISDTHLTHKEEITNLEEIHVEKIINKSSDNVEQIESQGTKIDAEVNKLKDIIFDQENSLTALSKALSEVNTDKDGAEIAADIEKFTEQLGKLERNIEESKVCMEILESENDRLQGELSEFETKYNSMCEQLATGEPQTSTSTESQPNENIDQLKNTLEQQNGQISELTDAIDGLQLEAEQAEKLKSTLEEFTRGSQEMTTCITILEEENERLLDRVEELENTSPQAGETDDSVLKQKTSLTLNFRTSMYLWKKNT